MELLLDAMICGLITDFRIEPVKHYNVFMNEIEISIRFQLGKEHMTTNLRISGKQMKLANYDFFTITVQDTLDIIANRQRKG